MVGVPINLRFWIRHYAAQLGEMEIPNLFLLSASLLLLLLPSLCDERCNSDDKEALLQIKKDLHDSYLFDKWDPDTDCCGWDYVKCDPNNNRVYSLHVFSGDMSAQIPDSVADLPFLETLAFRQLSDLHGPIPEAISKLKRLKVINMKWNRLTGPVPAFIGELKDLEKLDLSSNKLSGAIPANLALLSNLVELHLDWNQFTGSIPDTFGTWAGSGLGPSLYLSHNQLSGIIPFSFNMFDAYIVDISSNMLEGDLSTFFNPHKITRVVDFSYNLLEFDLSGVTFPHTISWLDLSKNKIVGSLPQMMTSMELETLNVSNNQLCGQIPVGGQLQRFGYSAYFNNKCLCGAPLESCK